MVSVANEVRNNIVQSEYIQCHHPHNTLHAVYENQNALPNISHVQYQSLSSTNTSLDFEAHRSPATSGLLEFPALRAHSGLDAIVCVRVGRRGAVTKELHTLSRVL